MFDTPTSLRLIREALDLAPVFGAQTIVTREVGMSDQTLVVDIVTKSDDSTRGRAEIASVMGVLAGLDIPTLFPNLRVQSFGVRDFDRRGDEILWVVSSLNAARFAADGQPIEWLTHSIIQENTPSYRRAQADRHIAQTETALRDLLEHHGASRDGSYLEDLFGRAEVEKLLQQLSRERGHAEGARQALDFTYLPQLRDAIARRFDWLDDGCVPPREDIVTALTELNHVRRKVAHHRWISREDVETCRRGAAAILVPMGAVHPELVEDFLVDRWEDVIDSLVSDMLHGVATPSVPQPGSTSSPAVMEAALASLTAQRVWVGAAIDRLHSLVVPAQRRTLNTVTLTALTRWRDAVDDLLSTAQRRGVTIDEMKAAQRRYAAAWADIRDIGKRIKEMRVGIDPAA